MLVRRGNNKQIMLKWPQKSDYNEILKVICTILARYIHPTKIGISFISCFGTRVDFEQSWDSGDETHREFRVSGKVFPSAELADLTYLGKYWRF